MEITHSLAILAERSTVYDTIADLTTWPDWMPGVSSVGPAESASGPAVGAEYRVTQVPGMPETYRIQELVPGSKVVVRGGGAVASALITYTLTDLPEWGTQVRTDVQWEGIGGKVLGAVFEGKYREQLLDEALGLKKLLEG
ncbi:MAG: SRPBCC family protein [Dermatophilus congolensis]|nr:SRPBCC family protein [Dermatophilus congolensis]